MSRVVRQKHVLLRDIDEEEEQVAVPLARLGADLLEHMLSFLTHREAAGARMTCLALREACRNLENGVGGVRHRYRLIVGCSASSRLVELDVSGGGGGRRTALARAWVTTRKPDKPAGAWLTAVKLHRGSLYACQYQKKGVLQFEGDSLRYKRIVASNNRLAAPEGLAFARGHMFVTSANRGCIFAYDISTGHEVDSATFADEELAGEEGNEADGNGDMVPWGMAVGPDGALYVSLDRGYVPLDGNYAVPPPPCASCGEMHRSGVITRVELLGGDERGETEGGGGGGAGRDGDGGEGGSGGGGGGGGGDRKRLKFGAMTTFCEGFSRPSGLTFTEDGDLLVASLDLQVSRFAGPSSRTPGRYLGIFYSMIKRNNTPRRVQARKENVSGYHSTCPDLQSFDVLATRHQGGRVYISIHSGLGKGDPRNEPREDGLVVCDENGKEIGFIQDESFEDANMLTGE